MGKKVTKLWMTFTFTQESHTIRIPNSFRCLFAKISGGIFQRNLWIGVATIYGSTTRGGALWGIVRHHTCREITWHVTFEVHFLFTGPLTHRIGTSWSCQSSMSRIPKAPQLVFAWFPVHDFVEASLSENIGFFAFNGKFDTDRHIYHFPRQGFCLLCSHLQRWPPPVRSTASPNTQRWSHWSWRWQRKPFVAAKCVFLCCNIRWLRTLLVYVMPPLQRFSE